MGSGAPDEGRKTTENDADTASLRDDDPDRSIPYIGTYLYTDPDERDDARHALAYHRGPGLWLPLVIFVVLLVSVALLGRYLWPAAPTAEAAPSASATQSRSAGNNPVGLPSGPTLPSPPTPPARPADLLSGWAERVSAAIAVPRVAVEAYGYAQLMLQRNDATCHLGWTTLAGIGEVASRHGQAAGATLQDNGRSVPPVVGPLLNGQGGQPLVGHRRRRVRRRRDL
jgi:hypothetical protein